MSGDRDRTRTSSVSHCHEIDSDSKSCRWVRSVRWPYPHRDRQVIALTHSAIRGTVESRETSLSLRVGGFPTLKPIVTGWMQPAEGFTGAPSRGRTHPMGALSPVGNGPTTGAARFRQATTAGPGRLTHPLSTSGPGNETIPRADIVPTRPVLGLLGVDPPVTPYSASTASIIQSPRRDRAVERPGRPTSECRPPVLLSMLT